MQKINTRAEKEVEGESTKELKRVRGKEGILLRLAEAAVAEPGGTVRKVIYPVAGESTLKAWRRRPRRTRPATGPGGVRCCARRTPTTGGGCSRRC